MYTRLTLAAALCLSASTLATTPAFAQQDVLDGLLACRAITDDAQRLQCFDAASSAVASAEESGDLVAVSRQEIEAVERDSFGLALPSIPFLTRNRGGDDAPRERAQIADATGSEVVERDDTGQISVIRLPIASARRLGNEYVFTLENGQVWRQTESRHVVVPRNLDGAFLEIRTAALGSFMAKVNGTGRNFRIRRVS
ncbi:MAG: hypothetical protein GYB36_03365 [Alphaproteobacteria bacterium]|nr:hypothetical protein [Alphaproteobacteria bacterium]